jgi:hypothetical protein
MRSLAKAYAKELWRERRMWAAWPPDQQIRPGTFGYAEGPLFVPVGQLADLNVEVSIAASPTKANETYASAGTVVFSSQADAELDIADMPLQPGVDVEVRFERRHGVFLLLTGCGTSRIDNLLQVAQAIADCKGTERWDDRWHVVTAARTAELGAVAVSREKNATVHLELRAQNAEMSGSLTFEFSHATRLGLQVAARGLLTPMLELRRAQTAQRVPVMRGDETATVAAGGVALLESEPVIDEER